MSRYDDFLKQKKLIDNGSGINADIKINEKLYPFQKKIVEWALARGRSAIWADCGLGKTFMQLEWARIISEKTNKPVLILAPLAVSQQTVKEGKKINIDVKYSRSQETATGNITITNYEMLEHFEANKFSGVVLDESSILKNFSGKMRNQIIETFSLTPFKLACTATPSPNDFMELGNHSEFIGAMTRAEMLTTFFVHDGGETSKWRLKRHAENDFWKWISSWAIMIRKPSDIDFDDNGFELPKLTFSQHIIDDNKPTPGFLIAMPAISLDEQRKVKRESIEERSNIAVGFAKLINRPVIIWCELNNESKFISESLGCPEITGSDSLEEKERKLLDFSEERNRVLVTKPSIAGFGMNWQHCSDMVFCNMTHSYESLYQAIRRCWRFGQKRPVHVLQIMMRSELPIFENMKRKQEDADRMAEFMEKHMNASLNETKEKTKRNADEYKGVKIKLPKFMGVEK